MRTAYVALLLILNLTSCTLVRLPDPNQERRLRGTFDLVTEVKEFGNSLGIEPTEALRQTSQGNPALSMLWLWLQRMGTLALRVPVDIRMAIGFHADREKIPLERVYRVEGYSVYYRQGNEFADARSVATVGFADEGIVRRVKVIFHEDLHGDQNFDLSWEIEESIITPLGSLAAVEFFRHKGDDDDLKRAMMSMEEERKFSRELNALAGEAERLFKAEPLEEAKRKILTLIPTFPTYQREFRRQIAGQNSSTALEAKLSHDLAYFKYFDAIASLSERAPNLKTLIADLKKLPRDTRHDGLESYLQELSARYPGAGT